MSKAINFIHFKELDAWDYQWAFKCFIGNERSIVPNVNLVHNIGFGEGAVHTTAVNKNVPTETDPMEFPLSHPTHMICDTKADALEGIKLFSGNSIIKKVLNKIR